MKKIGAFILLVSCITVPVISWTNWSFDIKQSKSNGDLIAHAIITYRKQNNALPLDLESLVPKYLYDLPRVQRTMRFLPSKDFKYSLHNIIPLSGCFFLTFQHKLDGLTYKYDSRNDSIIYTRNGTKPDYIEENITFEDIYLLRSKILAYYSDSLKYPTELTELIPDYMDSFPYDTSARYRPYDIAPNFSAELLEYELHQPCDTFRGNFRLYFDVSFGRYYYNTFTNTGGWGYDDD
jgi:hypothetical protein